MAPPRPAPLRLAGASRLARRRLAAASSESTRSNTPRRGLRAQQRPRGTFVVLANRVDERRDQAGEVRRAGARELLAERRELTDIVAAGRLEAADDQVLERVVQREQRRGDLRAILAQRSGSPSGLHSA